jgi:hypothetical protein
MRREERREWGEDRDRERGSWLGKKELRKKEKGVWGNGFLARCWLSALFFFFPALLLAGCCYTFLLPTSYKFHLARYKLVTFDYDPPSNKPLVERPRAKTTSPILSLALFFPLPHFKTGIYTTIYHAWFFLWYACGVQSSMWWMWYIVVTSTGPLQVMQRVRVLKYRIRLGVFVFKVCGDNLLPLFNWSVACY